MSKPKKKPYEVTPNAFQKWSPVDATAIYQHARMIGNYCAQVRSIMPRLHRFDLGADLYRAAKNLMLAMRREYRAPRFPRTKLNLLEDVLLKCDEVIVVLQTCQDVNAVSGMHFDMIASECRAFIESAMRMIFAEQKKLKEYEARIAQQKQANSQNPQSPTEKPAASGECISSGRASSQQ